MVKKLGQLLIQHRIGFWHLAILAVLLILLPIMPVYVNVLLWIGYILSQIIRYTKTRFVFTLAFLVGLFASTMNLVLTQEFGYSLYIAIPTAVIMLAMIGIFIVEIARYIRKKDMKGIFYAFTAVLFLAFFEVVFGNIHVRTSGAYLLIYERFEFFSVYWLFRLYIETYLFFYYAIMSGYCVIVIVVSFFKNRKTTEMALSSNTDKS